MWACSLWRSACSDHCHQTCKRCLSAAFSTAQSQAHNGSKLARRVPLTVSILGLSGKRDDGVPGIGKSCLCSRMINGAADDYASVGEEHSSVYSHRHFQDKVINGDHFLYHGFAEKRFDGGLTVDLHVIEQTEILDAESGQMPFQPPNYRIYDERALAPTLTSSSSGKQAYYNHADTHSASQTRSRQAFPSDKRVAAYVLVYDPTCPAGRRQQQKLLLAQLSQALGRRREKTVLVISKCDKFSADDLRKLEREHDELARNLKLPLGGIGVSARTGVNVDELIQFLAIRVAGKLKPGPSVPGSSAKRYTDAAVVRQKAVEKSIEAWAGLVRAKVTKFDKHWPELRYEVKDNAVFKKMCQLNGLEEARKVFLGHLLEIKIDEIKKKVLADPSLGAKGSDYGLAASQLLLSHAASIEQALIEHPEFRLVKLFNLGSWKLFCSV